MVWKTWWYETGIIYVQASNRVSLYLLQSINPDKQSYPTDNSTGNGPTHWQSHLKLTSDRHDYRDRDPDGHYRVHGDYFGPGADNQGD